MGQRTNSSKDVKSFIGLTCLSLWIQLALQNLYIACTYADHVIAASTVVTVFFIVSLTVTLVGSLLVSRRVSAGVLYRMCAVVLAVMSGLFIFAFLVQHEYRFGITCAFATAAGIFTGILALLWSLSFDPHKPLQNLGRFFIANAIALIAMFAVFSWFGKVIWFDFGRGEPLLFLWVFLLLAFVICALVLKPRTLPEAVHTDVGAGDIGTPQSPASVSETHEPGKHVRATAIRNLVQLDGRLYAGAFIFAFCAALHWEINAMRNGNSFDIAWSCFGYPVSANAMSLSYIILSLIILAVGIVLIRCFSTRMHPRTIMTVIFYGIGSAFFVPGLLGISYVSPAGFMMVGMFFFESCAFFFLLRDSGASDLPRLPIIIPFFALLIIGLGLGLVVSWTISPSVFDSEVFYNTLTALSLFFVMIAPTLLFKRQSFSVADDTERHADRFAEGCHLLAREKDLSPREAEVMELAAHGYSAPAIASGLFISENTVKVHLRHIYEKLDIHTKQELISCVENRATSLGGQKD